MNPSLRFTPTAWAKLLFLRDIGSTEVGAFGITGLDDMLLVREIQLVRQRCTETFVSFDRQAVKLLTNAGMSARSLGPNS